MKGEGYCIDPGDATAIRPEIRLTSAVVTGIRLINAASKLCEWAQWRASAALCRSVLYLTPLTPSIERPKI